MKPTTLTFSFLFALVTSLSPNVAFAQLYFEGFESYSPGQGISSSSAIWGLWPSPGATDALVSDEVALSGENSLKLESTDLIGGPTDVVLFAGLIGAYEVTFNVHVPAGNSGYYNVQGSITMGEI